MSSLAPVARLGWVEKSILIEVVSQQEKEIIKTALRHLLRDAVTLKTSLTKYPGPERSALPS